jgi:predicted unusual protein kinase regulating ubiquinone biosynthesis (AarF/ABC1/UbiB family)
MVSASGVLGGGTAERPRQLLAADDRIVIPGVIADRSSQRVLTAT